ncbi:MAG: phosphoglycerate kinase [Defluviitaleaceae bacterium]|nr:phosphoglycerate kinase [Defluviitaleaceae bacterium]MCL2263489.1 phosphoglycerate kinase [Defluviitaleaceae bacterium]
MMLNKKSVNDINVKGKRVLVRCDFNVPIIDGKITDESRILGALPTLKKLIGDGGRLILCSHLGKPKGPDPSASLAPVAERLSSHLGQTVKFIDCDNVVCDDCRAKVSELKDGEVALLQNTRFRPEEGKNDDAFSKDLASIADVYVNDAFGAVHRAHCSTVGVTKFVKETAVGYLVEKELKFLGNAVEDPVRPFVAILGGAKVSDKIQVINKLLDKVDKLIIGGGMAYTFFAAQGHGVGTSLLEKDKIDVAKETIEKAKAKGVELLLPVDTVVAKEFAKDAEHKTVPSSGIEDGWMGLDIGEKTREIFTDAIKSAKTVIWNGPMGVFEFPNFAKGTLALAQVLASMDDATTIIGGGDSAAAVNQLGYGDKMSHISTGGGASLEFLEGKELPGVVAVQDK